jgi:hypothetical protein
MIVEGWNRTGYGSVRHLRSKRIYKTCHTIVCVTKMRRIFMAWHEPHAFRIPVLAAILGRQLY